MTVLVIIATTHESGEPPISEVLAEVDSRTTHTLIILGVCECHNRVALRI